MHRTRHQHKKSNQKSTTLLLFCSCRVPDQLRGSYQPPQATMTPTLSSLKCSHGVLRAQKAKRNGVSHPCANNHHTPLLHKTSNDRFSSDRHQQRKAPPVQTPTTTSYPLFSQASQRLNEITFAPTHTNVAPSYSTYTQAATRQRHRSYRIMHVNQCT